MNYWNATSALQLLWMLNLQDKTTAKVKLTKTQLEWTYPNIHSVHPKTPYSYLLNVC